jgi:DNA-binding transcriptional ArsR family regulator
MTNNDCCLLFHALADRTRQRILELLSKREMTVSELVREFDISQPSVSHHLDILKRAKVVHYDKRGREVFYSINLDEIEECCGSFFKVIKIKVSKA